MTRDLSERRARDVLWIGGAAVALILTCGKGIPALRAWTSAEQESSRTLEANARQALMDLRDLPALKDSALARRSALGDEFPTLLHGTSIAAASADLAEIVSTAAADAGVDVGAIDLSVDSAGQSAYMRVTARSEIRGGVEGIALMLASLENGGRRLSVRSLSVDRTGGAGGDGSMRLALVLDGLARRSAPPPSIQVHRVRR